MSSSAPLPTAAAFRAAMSHFATGVTVVSSWRDGQPYGLTVSAFCSVSLDPLLVLVSLHRTSRTCAQIVQSGIFAVNILTAEQQTMAERFAGQEERHAMFIEIQHHRGISGAPCLEDTLACVECQVVASYPGGDHVLLLGQVVALTTDLRMTAEPSASGEPLLVYRSDYRRLRADVTEGA
jgi:flavin reductase (DIM6/NTAB) family NADH-FMN oxidoreductase RutF